MKLRRAFPLLAFAALACATLLPAASAKISQDQKGGLQLRTVHGSIVDKDENPAPSGVVYLENKKTQEVRTYIADATGRYRFSGLDPNMDYEIHAEKDDMTSSTRAISSFDSRRDLGIILKLTHKKHAK